MVGVMSYLYEPHVEEELRLNLNGTFVENYKLDESKTKAIDLMQTEVVYTHWDPQSVGTEARHVNSNVFLFSVRGKKISP
jgi:hypothetical protein